MLPSRIGRYEVLGQLASGGMAEILLARLTGPAQFRRAVVIKRILRSFAGNDKFVRMFLDEARIVASLRHPNIVHVQELGEHEGEAFLVMEYVEGENAASLLKRATKAGEPLAPAMVAHLVAELCAGLHAAHELKDEEGAPQNLVHRDVSPQNVMVGYDGHVKLVDFGVALFDRKGATTQTGEMKGKLEYLSPEQGQAKPLDRRSDIFSTGIVLYELSTGRRLFKRASAVGALNAICREPITPPSRSMPPGSAPYPPKLDAIVMRALSKDPRERYATAAEMRRELLEVARAIETPVEDVSAQMHRLFADRIAERRELLRKVSMNEVIVAAEVPVGETDDTVEVPVAPPAPPPLPPPSIGVETIAATAFLAPAADPSARVWRGAAIAIAIATVASFGTLGLVLRHRMQSNPPPVTVATAPTAAPLISEEDDDAGPDVVTVHVETKPAGASVLVGGVDRGMTPLDVTLHEGTRPIVLEIQRQGYVTATQTIVPDADQKVLVGLTPVIVHGRPAVRPPRPGRPAPSSSAGGFRRFD